MIVKTYRDVRTSAERPFDAMPVVASDTYHPVVKILRRSIVHLSGMLRYMWVGLYG
jgi:hypothetical protein